MRRLLVDTDPSAGIQAADVDDVLAIAFALGSPDAALEGFTVVAGNVELDEAVASALLTLEILDRPGVPVYPGAAKALVRDRAEIRALLGPRREDPLARELWAEVPHPVARLRAQSIRAAEFIVETVLAAPGEITLVALGPLTNVALALLLEPNLAAAVREIVFMGGNLGARHPGVAAIEFNVANDPEAAHVVLRSGAPLTMVGLDVTTQTCLTLDELDAVTAAGTPAARFLRRTCAPWIRFVRARRALEGCWLHDPLAVAVALDPSLVTTERREVGVELRRDAAYGQTAAGGAGLVDVCVAVDDARFMARLLPALRRIVEGPR